MKDYSEFIKGKNEIKGAGFVKEYFIEDGKIFVYTPDTVGTRPNIYEATPEEVKYYEDRLDKQYDLVYENQDKIVKSKKGKARKFIYTTSILIFSFATILLLGDKSIEMLNILSKLGFIAGASTIATGELGLAMYKELFTAKMNTYKEYRVKRQKIEELAKEDQNITKYLKESTLEKIRENETLQQNGLIENVYNIDLMDKISLKELRELLLRYRTSEALYKEQIFCMPNQSYISQEKAKTKALNKEKH